MSWISVEEKLPKLFDEVFIYPRPEFNDMEVFSGWINNHDEWVASYCDNYGCYEDPVKITHWQPLMESPK